MKSSKNIEVIEIKKPNIINGLDFSLALSLGIFLIDRNSLSLFLLRRLEKGLVTKIFKELSLLA